MGSTNTPQPFVPTVSIPHGSVPHHTLNRQRPQPEESPFSYSALIHCLNCYFCSKDSPGSPGKINSSPPMLSLLSFPYQCSTWLFQLLSQSKNTQASEVQTWICFIFQVASTSFVAVDSPFLWAASSLNSTSFCPIILQSLHISLGQAGPGQGAYLLSDIAPLCIKY